VIYLELSSEIPPERNDLPPRLKWAWAMLRYVARGRFAGDTAFRQLVVSTALRSANTFKSILVLVETGLPSQAAMLARPLFEDLVVGHWLLLNRTDPDWLVERFFRHRDAIALHQTKVERDTRWTMGPALPTAPKVASKQNPLLAEFGGEAQKNWWDPGDDKGRPLGLRRIAEKLEQAAADGTMFSPRFAGGDEPLLRRFEQAAYKWFTQFLHHTAIGLPMQPMPEGDSVETPDPSGRVLFITGWTFAQQAYLLHELYGQGSYEFDHLLGAWLTEGYGADLETLNWPYSYDNDA
jgi:hypothetical protein